MKHVFPRRALRFLLSVPLMSWSGGALATSRVVSPLDGATVGLRPKLVFYYSDFRPQMRFSLELSPDKFDKEIKTFDMRKSMRGWGLYLDDNEKEQVARGGQFTVPMELPEGTWWWRVAAHDGAADRPLDFVSSFRVDSTPPAEVDGLNVSYDKQSKKATLKWKAVYVDDNGGPESVSLYRVYRYDRRGPFLSSHLMLAGTSDETTFVEGEALRTRSSVIYYKVTAVDEVGNESAPKRDPSSAALRPQRPEKKHPPKEGQHRRRKGRNKPSDAAAPSSPFSEKPQ